MVIAVPLPMRDAVLLLLLEPVEGITRLQKYTFLAEQGDQGPAAGPGDADFQAYKFGPYSEKLYDDLEMLENLGLVVSKPLRDAPVEEDDEADLSFGFLIGDDEEQEAKAELEERCYSLTQKGRDFVEGSILPRTNPDDVAAIERIRSRFASYSLRDLLRYVYRKYPEWTVNSEIRDQIL